MGSSASSTVFVKRGSPARDSEEVRGIPLALDGDRIRLARDFREVIGGQFDAGPAEVLFEPVGLGGAGDRHDPGLLRQEPRERDPRGGGLLLAGDALEQIHQRLVLLQRLRREARQDAPEVAFGELGVLVPRSRGRKLRGDCFQVGVFS